MVRCRLGCLGAIDPGVWRPNRPGRCSGVETPRCTLWTVTWVHPAVAESSASALPTQQGWPAVALRSSSNDSLSWTRKEHRNHGSRFPLPQGSPHPSRDADSQSAADAGTCALSPRNALRGSPQKLQRPSTKSQTNPKAPMTRHPSVRRMVHGRADLAIQSAWRRFPAACPRPFDGGPERRERVPLGFRW